MFNLSILAHVDTGKTGLTERLLFSAGVIDTMASVDEGNTQTDWLALERQRGITNKSAVTSLVIDAMTVNLVDTPGHPDFIIEVERVLFETDLQRPANAQRFHDTFHEPSSCLHLDTIASRTTASIRVSR